MKRKHLAPLFLLVLIAACSNRPTVNVTRIGELESLIKKGDMKTHARLKDYDTTQHLYAIGSVTGLKGFIQILDSRPYTVQVIDNQLMVDSSWNTEATLFLYCTVDEWKEVRIPSDVNTWKQLEQFIGNEAAKYKIPKNEVSPFLLKGTAATVAWHVVDWDSTDKAVTYKKTTQKGMHGTLQDEALEAVCFYSRESYEVLAHKETNMHIHFINHNRTVGGHMDDIALDGRMKLYLPKKYETTE